MDYNYETGNMGYGGGFTDEMQTASYCRSQVLKVYPIASTKSYYTPFSGDWMIITNGFGHEIGCARFQDEAWIDAYNLLKFQGKIKDF